ncbi:MAG TPA: hypothetical protein VGZ71_14710 [Puia sp.]|nr:hypothetical protein [Puia sp.]
MKRSPAIALIMIIFTKATMAQTIYVNAISGSDDAVGSETKPVMTLQKAVFLAKRSENNEPVTIKLSPGLYSLSSQVRIEPRHTNDTARYILEAAVMPDDKTWKPSFMPVIQSISKNNTFKYFAKCAGIEVDRDNVCIKGLKFVGNSNPAADYYYPIEKDSPLLKTLEVSQCLFVGEKNGLPIQGAIYAEGPGLHVDHCIFYDCKNAVLTFDHTADFSITHSIIYGAYEAAIWYSTTSQPELPFTFSNNVVSHCHYFWASAKGDHPSYGFNNSLICENEHYIGYQDGRGGVKAADGNVNYKEAGIRKSGKVLLTEVTTEGLPHNYLNLTADSDGRDLDAGVFKMSKK